MRITDVTPTDLYGGTAGRPLPIVRVTLAGDPATARDSAGVPVTVRVQGPAVTTPQPARAAAPAPGDQLDVEVSIEVAAPHIPGTPVEVLAVAETASARAEQAATI